MVRALNAVIVMAVSVSGSYLTGAFNARGRSRRTEMSLGAITGVRHEASAWIVPQGSRRTLKPSLASTLPPIRALRRV